MAGLDIIKGYKEGDQVETSSVPEISADTTQTANQPSGGLPVKMTPKGPTATGNVVADSELLKNMEAFLAERNSPMARIQRGLEQATAWAVPNTEGLKSQALNALATRQNKEAEDIFAQQSNLATMKAALKQQELFDKARMAGNAEVGGLQGTPGAMTYNGVTLPPELQAIYTSPGLTKEKWDKEFNTWAQNTMKERASASSQTQQEYRDPKTGALLGYFTPAQWSQMQQSGAVGVPTGNVIVPKTTPPTTTTGGVNAGNIQTVESGNRPGLVSSKGAQGVMQVMPNTQKDPGFGVTPAKDSSEAELARVGRDYYAAMQNRYGHDTLAAIAYNMGPKATDDWLAKGGAFKDLPAETRDYIGKVNLANALESRKTTTGAVTPAATATAAAPTTTATTASATGPNPLEQRKIELGAKAKGAEAESSKMGELYAPMAIKVRENGRTAGERSIANDKALALLEDPDVKDLVGKFQTGSKGDAFVRQVQAGIEAGNFGSVGMKDLLQNLSKVGASKTQIDKFEQLANVYKQNELDWANNYLKGSGSVSDNERNLVRDVVGSVTDPIGKLKVVTATMKERADFDKEVANAYKKFGKNGSFGDFLDSDEYAAIEAQHNNRLAKIFGRDPESLKSNNAYNVNATSAQGGGAESKYKAGEVVGGFKFKGGDWKDKSNWEKAK